MRTILLLRMLGTGAILALSLGTYLAHGGPRLHIDRLSDEDDLIATALRASSAPGEREASSGGLADPREPAVAADEGAHDEVAGNTLALADEAELSSWREPHATALSRIEEARPAVTAPSVTADPSASSAVIAQTGPTWTSRDLGFETEESPDNLAWVLIPSAVALGMLGIGLLAWRYRSRGRERTQPPLLLVNVGERAGSENPPAEHNARR